MVVWVTQWGWCHCTRVAVPMAVDRGRCSRVCAREVVGGGVVGDMSPSTRFCVSEVAGGGDGVRDATLVLA